ncbi:MAG: sensor histidine kinase [Clostridia bacterium]|nr:sensor histidine kinase [Clostridia bacterium]
MFDFSAPLFWYKLVFMGELLIAEALATYTLKKKSRFVLRAVLSVSGCLAVAFLYPLFSFSYNAAYTSVMFFILFGSTLIGMKMCYDESWVNLIFCGIIAYTTQHIAYEINSLTMTAFDLGNIGSYYGGAPSGESNPLMYLTYFCAYFFTYWFVWAFIEYRIRRQQSLKVENLSLFFFCAVIVVIDIVLSTVVTYLPYVPESKSYKTVIGIYNILSCGLAVGMLFSMLGKRIAEQELETVEDLWARERKQYEFSSRNVELINIKCHDLKKQIRALSEGHEVIDGEALKEIEKAVNIYDGAVKTGNDIIDVVLAEKSLICESEGIAFTVIADGGALSFMGKTELYSLIENALSNAIESCLKTEDKSERFVKLHIRRISGMASIHVENYCKEKPKFTNGLPETSKGDRDYHGYGMRSMQLISEKYGGGLKAAWSDCVFTLDVAIPLQTGQKLS